jgi:hypothetical protein
LVVNQMYWKNATMPSVLYDKTPELYDKLEKDLTKPNPRFQMLFKEKPSEK